MTPRQLKAEYARSSLRQMAARRGCSWQNVQKMLKRRGIRLRPRGGNVRRFTPEAQ